MKTAITTALCSGFIMAILGCSPGEITEVETASSDTAYTLPGFDFDPSADASAGENAAEFDNPEAPGAGDALAGFRQAGEDEEGAGASKNDLEALQVAVDYYDRMRSAASDDGRWPELKELSQLVKVRLLKRLPEPPAGQQYVLDPNTLKVSLAAQ